jgi:hypothetical protein
MPFFASGIWSMSDVREPFNTAEAIPDRLAKVLSDRSSFDRAAAEPASSVLDGIRHSLAHGGVMYLDARGASSRDEDRVAMLAFVSVGYSEDAKHYRTIRVSEAGFEAFLVSWAEWIAWGPVNETLGDAR